MSCKKCKKTTCLTPKFCDYKISTSADYVTMEKDLECLGIDRGKKVDDILLAIDERLCNMELPTLTSTSIENVGGGEAVYKGERGDGAKLFRTLLSLNNQLIIKQEEDELSFDLDIDKLNIGSSCDSGTSIIDREEDNTVLLRGLKSKSLNISAENGCITIEFSDQIGIPRYIVNNLYTGEEEEGTINKPFKTIRAAFNKFIGNGTLDTPENQGAYIIIQKGNVYNYKDNLTARNLNIILEEGVEVSHNPDTDDWIINYDLLNNNKSITNFELKRNSRLILRSMGFKNMGSLGGEPQMKIIDIHGQGKIEMIGNIQNGHTMFVSNIENMGGFAMPNRQNISVTGLTIESDKKAIWEVGGDSTVRFKNCKIVHGYKNTVLPTSAKSFRQLGGEVILDDCELIIGGTKRDDLFYLKNEYVTKCSLKLYRCKLTYPQIITNLFRNADSINNSYVECVGLISEPAVLNSISNLFSSIVKWEYNFANNNSFPSGKIPPNVSLNLNKTVSVENWIGGNIVGNYKRFNSRQEAMNSGLPDGTKFLQKINIGSEEEWILTVI